MSKKIAVYGSLRKGEYNYDRFQEYYPGHIKYIGTEVIKGFDLFSLGSYPGVKKSDNPEQSLVIDVLEVSDSCYSSISAMEHGAGYDSVDVTINGEVCTIYEYMGNKRTPIESGDWSKYLSETKESYV